MFQPLVYFAAVLWAVSFAAYGFYVLLKRSPMSLTQRFVGLSASILVGAMGASILIGILYLFTELLGSL